VKIGVLGGGQLGRMLGLAGESLGFSFTFLEPAAECPAAAAGHWIRARFEDRAGLRELISRTDLVTYEFENVPVAAVRAIAAQRPVHPSAVSLEAAQDRWNEKALFRRLEIPTPRSEPVTDVEELARAIERIGLPAVLKTRRMGYDGRGQRVLHSAADAQAAHASLGGGPMILEEFVPFERELSLVAMRSRAGEFACYPLIENHHREGILRLSLAPAPALPAGLQAAAEEHARRLLDALGHVGVLALEMFQHRGGLLANEMAPRVHNSGHWTIEGAATSQFENHLRAITGLPLGSTAVPGTRAMVNLIGEIPDLGGSATVPGTHLHVYGKLPRPGRKLGHVTLCAADLPALRSMLARVWSRLGADAGPLPAPTVRGAAATGT